MLEQERQGVWRFGKELYGSKARYVQVITNRFPASACDSLDVYLVVGFRGPAITDGDTAVCRAVSRGYQTTLRGSWHKERRAVGLADDKPKRIPEILAEIDYQHIKEMVLAICVVSQKLVYYGSKFLKMRKPVPLFPSLVYFTKEEAEEFSKLLNDVCGIPIYLLMRTAERFWMKCRCRS